MSKANVFAVILIYALILSTFMIDKDVLYYVYILIVLYENNYKIICHTKTTIVLWKTCELNFAFAKENKLARYLYETKIRLIINTIFIKFMNLKLLFMT